MKRAIVDIEIMAAADGIVAMVNSNLARIGLLLRWNRFGHLDNAYDWLLPNLKRQMCIIGHIDKNSDLNG